MNLHELVSQLIIDTKGAPGASVWDSSLGKFAPELTLCATIILMLLVRVFPFGRRIHGFYFALVGSLVALFLANPLELLTPGAVQRMEIFTGMLVYDPFTVFMRSLFLLFAVLFAIFSKLSGIPDREDSADIFTLFLGATLGLCLMASANHLMMVFMAVEIASVPSYALAGMLKGRRVASEAALKYSVYGAGAAGVMLYGISLVAGLVHTAHLPTLATRLALQLPDMPGSEIAVLVLAGVMIMAGLAFKLSAVPFHFWCPDVFEGATAEVNAFLSIASKAAALALLVRVAIGFGALPPAGLPAGRPVAEAAQGATAPDDDTAAATRNSSVVFVATQVQVDEDVRRGIVLDPRSEAVNEALVPVRDFLAKMIALLAVITCTFGNLAAYAQTNIKRLLAYSTIAHAGYMMMPVAAMLAMAGSAPGQAERAIAALAVYIGVYLFMNLGAFAIVAFLRNAMHSEEIADYAGLIRRSPFVVICFALILFSLIGLPPLSGFIGKFAIFAALVDGYRVTSQGYLLVLLVVGGINTAISLFYYLRVARVMTMEPEPADRRPFSFSGVSLQGAFVGLVTAPTLLLIIDWDGLNKLALGASRLLLGS